MNVLVITADKPTAIAAGASRTTLRHRTSPEVRFWWPRLDHDALQGNRFDMVVLDRDAQLTDYQREWIWAHCTYGTTLWIDGAPALPLVTT